jgi:uncharacterized protein (TIGR01244 family)
MPALRSRREPPRIFSIIDPRAGPANNLLSSFILSDRVMSNKRLFAISVICTMCGALVFLYIKRSQRPLFRSVGDDVYISSQIKPDGVQAMRQRGIITIIDIRPDGEATDQPTHIQMEQAAKANGLDFDYIPVPHESIPPAAVDSLSRALSARHKPVVLYCRTGRRAVRTFALSEASRQGGPSVDAILAMVRDTGFSADDLRDNIVTRIANRNSTEGRTDGSSSTPIAAGH